MTDLWKRKLAAYLHDPPHKPIGIKDHEEQRASFLNRFGLSLEDMAAFERFACGDSERRKAMERALSAHRASPSVLWNGAH